MAGGGNFGSGFLAAGVGSLAPTPTGHQNWGQTAVGTVESAVLGGIGSELGGGKFANGAETGAFGYLFNQMMHQNDFREADNLTPKDQANVDLAKQIDDYISGKQPNSPLVGKGDAIVSDSLMFGVDPRLLVGIANAETSLGMNITAGANNIFNNLYSGMNSPFDSTDSAIYSEAHMLNHTYLGTGLNDTKSISTVYCTSGCTHWLPTVNSTIKTLGGNPDDVRQ